MSPAERREARTSELSCTQLYLGKVAVHKVDNIEFSRFARKHPSFESL
jgi:hypothetical protein